MMTFKIAKSIALSLALSFAGSAVAADKDMNADLNDVAISGYDTVAYFTKKMPVQGVDKFTAVYKNTIYKFSSEQNRDAFKANPEKFAPQFGGYCAMGIAMEKKFNVDPMAWRIVDDKLYLNLNKDVQTKWSSDIPGNLKTAQGNWPTIKDKAASEL
jgi:YHS domain-containing protein